MQSYVFTTYVLLPSFLTVVAGGVEADADRRHLGRPLAVALAAVDLLPVEAAERVALLAVVTRDRAALVLLLALGDLQGREGGAEGGLDGYLLFGSELEQFIL